ncbi:hypothetical protein I3271_19080, partial [Photobacterium leiognathi]|uniref:glycosyltransferase n=1 Tax=Photobacterium leiognathi TaxID=553611 RepID=UPI001EE0778D
MNRKKVLILLPSLKKTGPINVALQICQSLNKKIDFHIISFSDGEQYDLFYQNSTNITVLQDRLFISKIIFVRNYLLKKEIKLLHAHCFLPDVVVFVLRYISNITSISTIHNYFYEDYKFKYGKNLGFIISKLHVFFMKRINVPVSCSQSVQSFNKFNYGIKSCFIRNGVLSTLKE